MNFIQRFIKEQFPSKKDRFIKGYQWALEQYNKGETIDDIYKWFEVGNTFDPGDAFDEGIRAFTQEYRFK